MVSGFHDVRWVEPSFVFMWDNTLLKNISRNFFLHDTHQNKVLANKEIKKYYKLPNYGQAT